jgi:hypothetical protein
MKIEKSEPQPSSGLYPRSALPPDAQPSERKVHAALASALPAGWSPWHSLKIRTKPGDFSEADFVIADQAHPARRGAVRGARERHRE